MPSLAAVGESWLVRLAVWLGMLVSSRVTWRFIGMRKPFAEEGSPQ
jgi:hypothetical protein